MKYKNYLVIKGKGFFVARGTPLQDDRTLAIVKSLNEPIIPKYSIIDIASGMFIKRGNSKKKLLEYWEENKERLTSQIYVSRTKDYYIVRVLELNEEKKNWRNSGYEVV